jgi:CRISPR/Cas system CSM-associated protein Csm3 (group 7 of RAMP superfamily)
MPDLRIALTITLTSALAIGAGGSSGSLADRSVLRDGRQQPIIPGSHIKGKTRHAAEQLVSQLAGVSVPAPFAAWPPDAPPAAAVIRALFGSQEYASPLRFADMRLQTISSMALRPSVSINRRRGTAEEARLLFQEAVVEGTSFANEAAITGRLDDQAGAALLWAALRLTDRWGGAKTRGLGWADIKVAVFWDGAHLDDETLAAGLSHLLPGERA